jgi:hypothetical protein
MSSPITDDDMRRDDRERDALLNALASRWKRFSRQGAPSWPAYAAFLGLLAGPVLAGSDIDLGLGQRTAQLERTPLDLTTLGERGDAATHYRAERALTLLRCDALASDRAALRHKYAQSPRVLESIDVGP